MRLLERLSNQPEFSRGYNTPPERVFIQRFPVYDQFERRSFSRAYDGVRRYFDRSKYQLYPIDILFFSMYDHLPCFFYQ